MDKPVDNVDNLMCMCGLIDSEVFRKPIVFNCGLETQANRQLLSNCQTNELQSLVGDLSLAIPISKYNYSRYLLIIIAVYVKITNKRDLSYREYIMNRGITYIDIDD